MLKLCDLKIEYRVNPIGLDEPQPAFSWKLKSDKKGVYQDSCRITVFEGEICVWNSGWLKTGQSLYHVYAGKALKPRAAYRVTVEVADSTGDTSSAEGSFEMGLMDYRGMEADWITHAYTDDLEPCAVFEKCFSLSKPIAKARAYVTALGVYAMELNGRRVGEDRFAPGWTAYQKRLQVQTWDLTPYLKKDNTLSVTVGNGWYKGILGFYNQGCHYGSRTALLGQIELTYTDGTAETIVTDESWLSATGPRRSSEIYHGEDIDFSLPEQEKLPAAKYDYTKEILVPQESEPVRITQRVPVKEVLHTPNGDTVLDFGQNLTGVVEARLCRPKGTTVTLRHAEALDEKGNLFTVNLRTAKAADTYICSGEDDLFLPEFTYHGFRYVAVDGLDEIDPAAFTACVLHTDFARPGSFSCSDEKITRLWQNVDWTMRSNYLDVPMDCPQRDERLGYTGDAEIFLPTALFHGDLALFYRKWLRDLRVEQSDEFGIPLSVPDILRTRTCVSVWHEAATIVPWLVWETYGDRRVLEEQYDSMARSVEYTRRLAGESGLLQNETSAQFGDWLALDYPKGPFRRIPEGLMHPSNEEKGGGTELHLIGNAYYLYSIDIMARTAAVLGKAEEKAKWQALYENVLQKFRAEYVTANGRLVSDTQTAAALALRFGLVEERHRGRVLDFLRLNLIKNKKHLRTGFVGTEYLTHVLSQNGLHQLMGDILFKEDCPSWLYEVNLGATTVWELWDGVNEDGSFNLFEMNSLNQYGFATIGDWLVKELAALSALEPGYKKSRIAPRPVKGIPEVKASYETPYGLLSVELKCRYGQITVHVRIPENTTAEVSLPGRESEELGSGDYDYVYETELSFEKEPYSEDSTLGQLLAQPAAESYFVERAPELAGSGFIRTFVANMTIVEIKTTMPRSFVPQYAIDLFEDMIDLLNRQAKEVQA